MPFHPVTTMLALRNAAILAALLAAPVAAQEAAPPAEPELIRRAGVWLDSLASADRFSGVVVLARGGVPVFERAVGMANRESARPNQVGTRFNLGSINKAFTSLAVRQLAAAGKVQLDSSLSFHWPDYPNPEVARQVTIRQLLQHASGIGGNIFAAPTGGTRGQLLHNRDFLPLFVEGPLQFAPGSQRRYSNAGYVVLGALIERLSGEDYYDYVRRHIYEPAGMIAAGHTALSELTAATATGYTRGEDGTGPPRPNADLLPGRGSAAGGGYATAADLLHFAAAVRQGRLGVPPQDGMGIAGGAPGLNAVLEMDLPGGYDLVVMANQDPPAAELVAERIRGWLGGGSRERRAPQPATRTTGP
jgi:CubicO group peptidase (beta-lactamase class C family)